MNNSFTLINISEKCTKTIVEVAQCNYLCKYRWLHREPNSNDDLHNYAGVKFQTFLGAL